ncbi:MAG: hypothetical protein RLZZ117_256 [Cyanobacteriota bacterium]|jgi:hypothetical protein
MLTLILYTRSGCCLCEGLEERLRNLLSAAGSMESASEAAQSPNALAGVRLQPVDVDRDPALQARYGLSVPVLAFADGSGGPITPLPPVSPRLQGEPLRDWLLRHLAG